MTKILIIDDDEDLQYATRMVLEKHGFEVASAYNPDEGIEKVQSEKPDLVLLDVIMPNDFEGFDVAKKIREELNMKELPIILLTAIHVNKKVPYRFAPHEEWLPVDYFYDKPIDPDVLVAKIKEFLNIPE
jgi:two-component system alkaline phosphatase synthesis response regulator PhoP